MPNGTAHNCSNCCNFKARGGIRRSRKGKPSSLSEGKCSLRLERIKNARWTTCWNFNDPDAKIKGRISRIEFDKSGEHAAYKLVRVGDARKAGSAKVKRVKGMGQSPLLFIMVDYLERIKDYNIRQASIVPDNAVLLVIDVQERFRYAVESVLDNIVSLIRCCRERGIKVVFTRHGHHDPVDDNCMMSVWWGGLAKYGTPEWELLEELHPNADGLGDLIVDKDTYNAFYRTDLDEQLRKSGVNDVIICGVFTDCCCETTARDVFVRDYRVFFVADATATVNEDLQLNSLKGLAHSSAYIVDTKQVNESLANYT